MAGAPCYTSAMDEIDVKREGNKAAEALGQRAGSMQGVRNMQTASIKAQYKLAVAFDGLPGDMFPSWLQGWRKGFGK
jgi:hypothetical protein